ncbi:MAG: histidine kinase [Bacteroidia bacterium]|nr:histidine kinase [Bacteroidia bacterium]
MPSKAQQFFFKNYSVESGLPFVQVSCIFQDSEGYLWSGGYGGLSRFDGKQFQNFNRKEGLIDHNVNSICADENGNVYVGTNKGLSVLSKKKFRNYDKTSGFVNPWITSICQRNKTSMFVGTAMGLYTFQDNQLKRIQNLDSFRVNCLYNLNNKQWFIGTDKGLMVYDNNTYQLFNETAGLPSNHVNCLTWYKNMLVIGTEKGLSFYNPQTGKFTNYYVENGLIDENITAVTNQRDQFLWVGSQTGLLRFDGTQFTYFNIGKDNNSNIARCILNDREDNMWFGTHSGLFRYRDNSFSTFEEVPGLGTSFIFQIFRDKREDLWVTSQNNGIYRETQNYFKKYSTKDGLSTNIIRSGLQDNEGRLIFGTNADVTQFKNEKFSTIPMPSDFKGAHDVMYLAKDGKVWIGGSNGVVSLTWSGGQPKTKFYHLRSKGEMMVYGFCEDDENNLYIGTMRAGLFKLTKDSLINLTARLKLNEETFFMLRYTDNKIFAASLNGLLILDITNNTLKKITDKEGLNSDLIYSIEFAENNKALWIGTNQGINRLNLEEYLKSGAIELSSFGKKEGFAGVECNGNGIWEDKNGTLWFGTVNGLIKYQPASFRRNTVENKTLIQSIKLKNEDTLLESGTILPGDLNSISFYYRGICLTNPDKVLYQRKLEGLEGDKNWSEPSTEDFCKYVNLPAGKYVFKVRSCNNEGIWNKEETKFVFRIKPPFYLTWWFLLLSFTGIVVAIYTVFRIRVYKIKKQQKLDYERKVEMSKIELKALRSQMNPHFIFNSLNSIQHYIFNAKSDEAIKYLNKFAKLVRVILNNSEKPTVTVGDDLEALSLYLELEQMRFEGKFDYEIIVEDNVDADYDIMPPLLMQPYVENAILHGLNPKPVKGKLTIRLSSKNNFLICTIEDNGIGREKAAEIRRTMPVKKYKSLGMKITEDRLKILNEINNSQLSVTITDLKGADNQAMGTRVELFVPLTG